MTKQITLLAAFFHLFFLDLFAQSAYAPVDRDYYHLIDRYSIISGKLDDSFHSTFKPYRRDALSAWVDEQAKDLMPRNANDRFNLSLLKNDNWEFSSTPTDNSKRPWKGIYKKSSDFFHYRDSVFDLHINPVLYFSGTRHRVSVER